MNGYEEKDSVGEVAAPDHKIIQGVDLSDLGLTPEEAEELIKELEEPESTRLDDQRAGE